VKIADWRPWFFPARVFHVKTVSRECSILFSHYLLTSGTRAWYEIRLKKIGFREEPFPAASFFLAATAAAAILLPP
jgi:hypothetical protein